MSCRVPISHHLASLKGRLTTEKQGKKTQTLAQLQFSVEGKNAAKNEVIRSQVLSPRRVMGGEERKIEKKRRRKGAGSKVKTPFKVRKSAKVDTRPTSPLGLRK